MSKWPMYMNTPMSVRARKLILISTCISTRRERVRAYLSGQVNVGTSTRSKGARDGKETGVCIYRRHRGHAYPMG